MRFLEASLVAVLPATVAAATIHKTPDAPSLTIGQSDEKLLSTDSIPGVCPQRPIHYAYRPGEPLKPRKLAELPPGNVYVAVLRHDVNGCEVPIVIKYDVGRR